MTTKEILRLLLDRKDLDQQQSEQLFAAVMDGELSDVEKSAALVALRLKRETADEITGAVRALRSRVTRVEAPPDSVDTCGTGGDGRGTINVSTLAGIVTAAAGVPVAKHGNRAVSSRCGSADLLEELGVAIDLDASAAAELLGSTGFAFLFAQRMHGAMRQVAAVRRELGVRTIFNLIGPLANPAFVTRQVIGVYAPELAETIASVLLQLGGVRHALVVHSDDGLDEISVDAPTTLIEVKDGVARQCRVTPEEFGLDLTRGGSIAGGTAGENARFARDLLAGSRSRARDLVIVNAAAAIYVGGAATSLRDGASIAAAAIDSGAASAKLDEVVSRSRALQERVA